MVRKAIPLIFTVCILLMFPAHAAKIGVMGGLGPYWVYDEISWGYALTVFVDIPIQNFEISPMLGFWSGIIADDRLIDVTPSIAFKYPFGARSAKLRPYIGFAPMLHFWWAHGQYDMHFGADAFAGVAVNFSKYTQIPLQFDYGFTFVEGRTVNKVTFKIGVSTSM